MPSPNAIFEQVNTVRQNAGLQPLARDDTLTALAEQRAQDMSAHGLYSHKGSNGLYFDQQLASQGHSIAYGCENLDLEFVTDATTYVNDWLRSTAGHRECVLNGAVSSAGYAVAPIAMNKRADMPTFVVVAIHATPPQNAR